jgi:hypothetical protein
MIAGKAGAYQKWRVGSWLHIQTLDKAVKVCKAQLVYPERQLQRKKIYSIGILSQYKKHFFLH